MKRKRNSGMHSAASSEAGPTGFSTRPSDVFIVTYPKCGTTWVTQILHQLRTHGDMSFGEITEVVPWDILAQDCGQDLNADQVAEPRVFKSHEPANKIARGARYIVVGREPRDALVSFHHFLPSFAGLPPGSVTIDEFTDGIFAGMSHSGYIWDFLCGWWRRRHEPEVRPRLPLPPESSRNPLAARTPGAPPRPKCAPPPGSPSPAGP
jgi:Sulfotransferase domain.